MTFTFIMVAILSLIVIFHKEFEDAKNEWAKRAANAATSSIDSALGTHIGGNT